jgi:hypothetical protein
LSKLKGGSSLTHGIWPAQRQFKKAAETPPLSIKAPAAEPNCNFHLAASIREFTNSSDWGILKREPNFYNKTHAKARTIHREKRDEFTFKAARDNGELKIPAAFALRQPRTVRARGITASHLKFLRAAGSGRKSAG